MSLRNKASAIIITGALAVALCPISAIAQPLEPLDLNTNATEGKAGQTTTLQAQAKTKKVYVLSKITRANSAYPNSETTYSYNKNGLLAKATTKTDPYDQESGKPEITKTTYVYKGNNLLKIKTASTTQVMKLAKNGLPQSSTLKYKGSKYKTEFTYRYNKSGKLVKMTRDGVECRFKYRNGRISKRTLNAPRTYSYDSQGNLTKIKGFFYGITDKSIYKNHYDSKKLLKKRTVNIPTGTRSDRFKNTYTYEFKRITVSASLASKVKAQTWSLINDNMNYALGALNE